MERTKLQTLQHHKRLATGLFILMTIVFMAMIILQKRSDAAYLGYIKAFAEAAMVGALADWFAVTALFHHPMGIPIPHTNLIENSKKRIGDNLGNFVVDNFLVANNIRPYINKLTVADKAAKWLSSEKNTQVLLEEASNIVTNLLHKTDDDKIAALLSSKASGLLKSLPLQDLSASAMDYVLAQNEQEAAVTAVAKKIKEFITENKTLVQQKVQEESYFFIPGFVDRKLANKITSGLTTYFNEIELDPQHRVRLEINEQLIRFAADLRSNPVWTEKLQSMAVQFATPEKLTMYSKDAWLQLKKSLTEDIKNEHSFIREYLSREIKTFATNLNEDVDQQDKIDRFVRYSAYKLILKNSKKAGELISNTVGNWEGRALSEKLELEVGKDLQFIRINGTLVGGLVGLLLYMISKFI